MMDPLSVKKRAEEICSFGLCGKEIFLKYGETKSKEEKKCILFAMCILFAPEREPDGRFAPEHPATHCNTLQHTATTLQHTATHCSTLQPHCNHTAPERENGSKKNAHRGQSVRFTIRR